MVSPPLRAKGGWKKKGGARTDGFLPIPHIEDARAHLDAAEQTRVERTASRTGPIALFDVHAVHVHRISSLSLSLFLLTVRASSLDNSSGG